MQVGVIKDGITISPETEFEHDFLKKIFTLNEQRSVTFNHDTGNLQVVVKPKKDGEGHV